MWPLSILYVLIFSVKIIRSYSADLITTHKSACYSCASFAYLPLWNQLMHHYFPPKNFSDRCWLPDSTMGTVQCSSACFTLVEKIDQHDYGSSNEYHGVMRGCVDRLLLFGMDDDVRNILTTSYPKTVCRQTDRKLLRLYPLSGESELVTLCTCTGDNCNEQDMLPAANSSLHLLPSICLSILFLLLFSSYL